MNSLFSKRPSPALVIALLALFVAMSGSGYAISRVPRSSVGTKQLKNNSVTTRKIKKDAVVGSKVKKNSITGTDILESSLGKVPDADKLDGLDSSVFERSGKITRVAFFSLGNNEAKDIYKQGPFTLTANCLINSAGADTATIYIATSQNNSAFDNDDNAADLDTTTALDSREFVKVSGAPTGTANFAQGSRGSAVAPDGSQFASQLWAGVNVLGQSGRCTFGGVIFANS